MFSVEKEIAGTQKQTGPCRRKDEGELDGRLLFICRKNFQPRHLEGRFVGQSGNRLVLESLYGADVASIRCFSGKSKRRIESHQGNAVFGFSETKTKSIVQHRQVSSLRKRIHDAGLYGSRVVVHHGEPLDFGLPPYFASVVTSEDPAGGVSARIVDLVQTTFECLRPYGGTSFLSLDAEKNHCSVKRLTGRTFRRA